MKLIASDRQPTRRLRALPDATQEVGSGRSDPRDRLIRNLRVGTGRPRVNRSHATTLCESATAVSRSDDQASAPALLGPERDVGARKPVVDLAGADLRRRQAESHVANRPLPRPPIDLHTKRSRFVRNFLQLFSSLPPPDHRSSPLRPSTDLPSRRAQSLSRIGSDSGSGLTSGDRSEKSACGQTGAWN